MPYHVAEKGGDTGEDLLNLLVDMMESDSENQQVLQSAVKLEEHGG